MAQSKCSSEKLRKNGRGISTMTARERLKELIETAIFSDGYCDNIDTLKIAIYKEITYNQLPCRCGFFKLYHDCNNCPLQSVNPVVKGGNCWDKDDGRVFEDTPLLHHSRKIGKAKKVKGEIL